MLEEVGGKIAEEVLDKYKVEDSKREAGRSRGSAGMEACTKKQKNTGYGSGDKTAGQEPSPWTENTTCRRQSMHEHSTEEEEEMRR